MYMSSEIMPERQDPEAVFEVRRQTVANYIDGLKGHDARNAQYVGSRILEEGEGASLAKTVVIVPVAAHQEASRIEPAMDEYAKQDTEEPFSIVLGLNHPADAMTTVDAINSFAEVEKAKTKHPQLDIRAVHIPYEDCVIGTIRRDLWNGVAIASQETGNFDSGAEVIGINHDIDVDFLSARYISSVQRRYAALDRRSLLLEQSPVSDSRSKHSFSFDHPNISRAVLWSDFVYRKSSVGFEAGKIIPMTFYAGNGGIQRGAQTHEVGLLTMRSTKPQKVIAGTSMETSPRRYIARMNEHGYAIWEDSSSFTATDECRERPSHEYPDISLSRMNEIVQNSLTEHANLLINRNFRAIETEGLLVQNEFEGALGDAHTGLSEEYIKAEFAHRKKLAGFVLNRLFNNQELNDTFEREYSRFLSARIDANALVHGRARA